MKWYKANDVVFMPMAENLPNWTQFRPIAKKISDYEWQASLSKKVFKNNQDLKKKQMKVCNKDGISIEKDLMGSVTSEVRGFSLGEKVE